jgi:hypothetical protein
MRGQGAMLKWNFHKGRSQEWLRHEERGPSQHWLQAVLVDGSGI